MEILTIHPYEALCSCYSCIKHWLHDFDQKHGACHCTFCVQERDPRHVVPQHTHSKCAPPPEPSACSMVFTGPISIECYRCDNIIDVPADATLDKNLCFNCGGTPPVSADGGHMLPKGASEAIIAACAAHAPDPDKFIRKQLNANLRGVFT